MINISRPAVIVAACLQLSACAAVFEGTTQKIYVSSNPPGASCDFMRKGQTIATVPSTPGFAKIRKTKDDIDITCKKDGYQNAGYHNKSDVAGATFGDIAGGVLTGGIAWAVDSGTGADNKYDGLVKVTLQPIDSNAPAVTPASTPAASPAATPAPATAVPAAAKTNPPSS